MKRIIACQKEYIKFLEKELNEAVVSLAAHDFPSRQKALDEQKRLKDEIKKAEIDIDKR